MFAKLNQAYGVLNDPHKRALYDCLGKDGISPDVLAVIPRTKTPKEIRDEYERLAKGQLISKANCQAVNSSKKRTNEWQIYVNVVVECPFT